MNRLTNSHNYEFGEFMTKSVYLIFIFTILLCYIGCQILTHLIFTQYFFRFKKCQRKLEIVNQKKIFKNVNINVITLGLWQNIITLC